MCCMGMLGGVPVPPSGYYVPPDWGRLVCAFAHIRPSTRAETMSFAPDAMVHPYLSRTSKTASVARLEVEAGYNPMWMGGFGMEGWL